MILWISKTTLCWARFYIFFRKFYMPPSNFIFNKSSHFDKNVWHEKVLGIIFCIKYVRCETAVRRRIQRNQIYQLLISCWYCRKRKRNQCNQRFYKIYYIMHSLRYRVTHKGWIINIVRLLISYFMTFLRTKQVRIKKNK